MRLSTALALKAGIGEEIFFSALLPLAAWQITGDPALALVAHDAVYPLTRRPGTTGIATTFVLGLLLAGVYLCARQPWFVMLLHVLNDVRTLRVTPWALRRKR